MTEGLHAQVGSFRLSLPITIVAAVVGAIFTAGVLYTQLGNWQAVNTDRNRQLLEKISEIKNDLASVDARINKINERLEQSTIRAQEERIDLNGKVTGLMSDMRNINAQVQFLLQRIDGWKNNDGKNPQ